MNALLTMPLSQDVEAAASKFDARVRSRMRTSMIAAAVLALMVLIGGILVPIGGAVIATAEVGPESRIKRIAHPTGGVIAEILVRDGDMVEDGDLLIRLDSNVTELSAEFSELSLAQLLARRAGLVAEIEERAAITFPAELIQDDSAEARAVIASEQRRFGISRSERASLRIQLDERVNQLGRQIDGYEAQISALRQQQELIGPELAMLRDMFDQGYVTIRRLNEMERQAIELEGSIGALRANIAQSNAGIAQAQEQRIQIGQTARAQAGAELAQIEAAINQQRVASASAGDTFDRSAIRAPYAGTIDKLAFGAVGEVIRPAETILEIVPRDDRLVFNGLVLPSDIDRVKDGQAARLRLSAFNQASTPELSGKVAFVSADPVTDQASGLRLYRVRVVLNPEDQAIADEMALVSGMPAELFIETGNRSMLSFLLKPLSDQFERAFRN
ncbi:HlyD family type I secretion periplasmic adaptor subunit [Qipengyuania sp. ASV99]|uniref:HlyD family type I secretion periplasmic adaptor subunit n=1 Tax=Qipengyuania sp. ASV99 TaxID=3399681 RepID=UPI003A4C6091